jgi:hypothetical protein
MTGRDTDRLPLASGKVTFIRLVSAAGAIDVLEQELHHAGLGEWFRRPSL